VVQTARTYDTLMLGQLYEVHNNTSSIYHVMTDELKNAFRNLLKFYV